MTITWLQKQLDKTNKEIDRLDSEIENIEPKHRKQINSIRSEKRKLIKQASEIKNMINKYMAHK